MRKLKKTEKMIIAISDDNYTTYDCSEHGIFQIRKDVDNGKCPYSTCKGSVVLVENINELREACKSELNLSINIV
jgi:uncharacterized protein YbcV (DUF1398 family)